MFLYLTLVHIVCTSQTSSTSPSHIFWALVCVRGRSSGMLDTRTLFSTWKQCLVILSVLHDRSGPARVGFPVGLRFSLKTTGLNETPRLTANKTTQYTWTEKKWLLSDFWTDESESNLLMQIFGSKKHLWLTQYNTIQFAFIHSFLIWMLDDSF